MTSVGQLTRSISQGSRSSFDSVTGRRKSNKALATWGTVGHLSSAEQATLEEFKKFVDDIGYPRNGEDRCDERCLVFLRARKFNLNKACKMYDDYARWRAENKVEGIMAEPLNDYETIKKSWIFAFHKHDKIGRPVYIERTGYIDVAALLKKGIKMEDVVRFHIYQQEYMFNLCKAAGKHEDRNIEQIFSIMDISGCSVGRHMNKYARQLFAQLASIDSNYYPESLGKLMIINAPAAFPIAWNFIKPLLDPRTRSKIEVYKAGKHVNKMKEHIAVENIPLWMGGKCECPNGGCIPTDGRKNYEYLVALGHKPIPGASPGSPKTRASSRVQEIVEEIPVNLSSESRPMPELADKKKGFFGAFKCGKGARLDNVSEPVITSSPRLSHAPTNN